MTENVARYTPKFGSLPHRVINFMVMNPDEELTRSDIATKFDAPHSTIDSLLALPVARGVLKRGRNSDMELVWSLGDNPGVVLDQAKPEEGAGSLPARCYPSTRTRESESYIDRSLPVAKASPFPSAAPVILDLTGIKVRKGVRLMTKEEKRRAEFAEWFAQFEVGDSAEFDEIHLSTMKTECTRHMRETKTKFRFAATGVGRHGVERTA
ncbi:hypothetical protein [uncultured Variovorax sp.]|uniref:hypothetical protein n=1 Tax=uncultured Variovorax sp. TaxID=114708 RepID=UPI0025ECBDD6|nr:hypothetical protein [uncultured Variovorax sp.]